MITATWDVVRRPGDGETVGYLVPDGELVVPLTLIGTPLATPSSEAEATALLVARGLPALDRRWWCRLPDPLPAGVLDAGEPEARWAWRSVVLVEVSPTACRVRPEWAPPAELTARAVLPVPVGERLRPEPPE